VFKTHTQMLGKIDMQSICRRGSSVSVPIRSVSNTSTKKPNKRQQGNLARKVKRALSKVMSYILVYLYMESFHLHNPFPSPPKKNVEHILTLRYIFIISHSLHYFYFKIAPETLHGILWMRRGQPFCFRARVQQSPLLSPPLLHLTIIHSKIIVSVGTITKQNWPTNEHIF
jgi:hypothetical protein